MQLYFFEREARFTLNDEAIDKLADLKTSTGEPVIPAAVTDKLAGGRRAGRDDPGRVQGEARGRA